MADVNIRREIEQRIDALGPEQQAQVLQFVASLSASTIKGESGLNLRQFARSLDSDSARQIAQAIEDGCEQADVSGW